jgi:hypothetical protein
MEDSVVYDDGRVRLDETGITLAHYYFPLATSKHLRYEDIASFRELPMGWLTGRLRGWGTTHPGYWLPLDPTRHHKRTLIVLDTGHWVKPAITPDDPAEVVRLLRARVGGAGT